MLEAAVAARGGAIELVKVDVDANPSIAQIFQVQSIPAVFAIKDAQVVDGFVGAVGAGEIEAFLDRVNPAPSEADLAAEAADEDALRAVLQENPGQPVAVVALATILVGSERAQEALDLLARIPPTPETRAIEAEARLALQAIDVKNQEVAPLLDGLLDKVKTDEDARQEYLDLLETMGPGSTVALEYRKKLAARLF